MVRYSNKMNVRVPTVISRKYTCDDTLNIKLYLTGHEDNKMAIKRIIVEYPMVCEG